MRHYREIVDKIIRSNPTKGWKGQRDLAWKALGSPENVDMNPRLREALSEPWRRVWYLNRRLKRRERGRGPGIIYTKILPKPGTKEHRDFKRAGLPGRMLSLHATKGWRTACIELV